MTRRLIISTEPSIQGYPVIGEVIQIHPTGWEYQINILCSLKIKWEREWDKIRWFSPSRNTFPASISTLLSLNLIDDLPEQAKKELKFLILNGELR